MYVYKLNMRDKIAEKVNPFWKDVFLNLSELKQEKGELVDGQHVLSQPIWLNPWIKIGGNMCMNKICCENGVFFVNDLISENKMLFTYEEFKNHYNIRLNFIEYFSILSAIPHRWKLLIRGIGKLKLIKNDIVDRLKRDPKPCKYFSKQYMLNVKMLPLNIQSKWEKEVHKGVVIEDYDWSCIYCIPFSVTKDTKLQDFQYKLVHRILITNSFLYKCGLKETELCTFCTETKESLVHIFWECNYVRNFWLSVGNFLKICGLSLPFNAKDIILGLTEHSSAQGTINNVIIILKYYIYVCRSKCRDPDLEGGLEFLKYAINIEKASMIYLSPVQKEHAKRKWLDLEAVLSG